MLLTDAERGADPDEIAERALLLLAATLEGSDRERVQSGRPASKKARRLLVDQSHLCRVIRDETGSTPSALREALSTAPQANRRS